MTRSRSLHPSKSYSIECSNDATGLCSHSLQLPLHQLTQAALLHTGSSEKELSHIDQTTNLSRAGSWQTGNRAVMKKRTTSIFEKWLFPLTVSKRKMTFTQELHANTTYRLMCLSNTQQASTFF